MKEEKSDFTNDWLRAGEWENVCLMMDGDRDCINGAGGEGICNSDGAEYWNKVAGQSL